ncbi:possible protein-tyrosine phosphatase [alpha proteobacterium U9-1i]|nr:possible protein-tyrosine phosphatase [alpha proteobacterium U9-1i]
MHDRLIKFDRILNFRDFGGWDTVDGGRIHRGVLFRSAAFHDASDADIEKLNAMGVRFLVDLRRPEERTHEPNKWPGETTRSIFNEDGYGAALPPHLQALLQDDLTAKTVRDYMLHIYRAFAFEARHIDLYRSWFRELAEGGPAIIHCAAGKDRTGLGCALTLLTLGVPEEAVFADYEFTNQAVDIEARLPRIKARMEERLQRKLDADALRPMLGVHVDYLRGALDEIAERHGSVEAYMRDVLGVGARERDALRARLRG